MNESTREAYEALLESIGAAVAMFDGEGRLIQANSAWCVLTGAAVEASGAPTTATAHHPAVTDSQTETPRPPNR